MLARQATELTQDQVDYAVEQTRSRLNRTSIQTLQELIGGHADGNWTSAFVHSLSRFQERTAGPANGLIGTATLDALVERALGRSLETRVIHLVADFLDLRLDDTVSSIRYAGSLQQEWYLSGGDAVGQILIGPPAMGSFSSIRQALTEAHERVSQPPAMGQPVGMPHDEAERTVVINMQTLRDPRSIRGLQSFLLGDVTGKWELDTCHRIADFQAREGLSTEKGDEGRLYDDTMRRILFLLSFHHYKRDVVIRMIVDWYRMDERGVVDVLYEPTQYAAQEVKFTGRPGPGEITFGTEAFAYGQESLVHTVQQAFAEANHHAAGMSPLQSEFLGARARVVSNVVDDFSTDLDPLLSRGFVLDAKEALDAFLALPQNVQERQAKAFESMRKAVVWRYELATPAERTGHAALLAAYQAVPVAPVNTP
jgi:hypothetical protein